MRADFHAEQHRQPQNTRQAQYGNDSHLGNDKDVLMGNHGGKGKFVVQGDGNAMNPPFVCAKLPNFVDLRGGDYFFLPSITALGMIGLGVVDPR